MSDTTEVALPAWWQEVETDLANLNIVSVAVTSTGTKPAPQWTAVVILHVEHLHWQSPVPITPPTDVCVAFPWVLGARPTEETAWKAVETFLRGVVAVRKGTGDRVPHIDRPNSAVSHKRMAKAICSVVDAWHDPHHGIV